MITVNMIMRGFVALLVLAAFSEVALAGPFPHNSTPVPELHAGSLGAAVTLAASATAILVSRFRRKQA